MERETTYAPPIPDDYDPVEEVENYLHAKIDTPQKLNRFLEERFYGTEQEQWLLEETGFEVLNQIRMYQRIRREAIHNKQDMETTNKQFYERTRADLLGFYWEFLQGSSVLPNPLFINMEERKVWGKRYGPLVNASSQHERDGVPLQTVLALNELLVDSRPDMTYMFVSPAGWAGEGWEHPESQFYIYHIGRNGDLQALTLRLDLDLEEHEQLIFGRNYSHLSERERIKNIVGQIKSTSSHGNLETAAMDVLKSVQHIKGNEVAWENRKKNGDLIKTHAFKDIAEVISNLESLNNVDSEVDTVLTEIETLLSQDIDWLDPDNLEILILHLGQSADKMLTIVKPELKDKSAKVRVQEMRELRGCTALRTGISKEELKKRGYKEKGYCAKCRTFTEWIGPCGVCYKCETGNSPA